MAEHGAAVAVSAEEVVVEQQRRQAVLGVDPRLIVVFETRGPIDSSEFRPAGLQVLDSSSRTVVVAFADDPELTSFMERLTTYQEGVPEGQQSARYQHFFDTIEGVRRYGAQDRVTERLELALEELDSGSNLLIDIECWFPDQAATANEWLLDVETAAQQAESEIVDRYFNSGANVAILRISASGDTIREIAEIDTIASIDLLPIPPIWTHEARALGVEDLPDLPPAPDNAPIVGLVDSGVRSAHPLLSGYIYDAVPIGAISDGEDRNGHGTAVASLIVWGALEEILADGPTTPVCQVLSTRVLDDRNLFPLGSIWEKELESAIRYCHSQGARIINVSLGNEKTPFRGPKSSPVAAVLDNLAKELSLVLVVSAGNVHVADYEHDCTDVLVDYPRAILDGDGFGILDPAPSAIAITVGAVVSKTTTTQADRVPIGNEGWPSPISRSGPGIEGSIKPEVVAPGGTMALERGSVVVEDSELQCLVANGEGPLGSVITASYGTSLAAPLVARAAAAVELRYPDSSANLIRALVMQATSPSVPLFIPAGPGMGEDRRIARSRRLIGYGEARFENCFRSELNRAVLTSQDTLPVDSVHIYEVPIPEAFFKTGGERLLTVSLSYDPGTRARRLDYLDSRMKFEIVRGLDPSTIERLFVESPDDMGNEESSTDDAEDATIVVTEFSRLSDLGAAQRPILEPSTRVRSAGANQLARKRFRRRLRPEDGQSFFLVIQNTGRWAIEGSPQDYAVAVVLEHSDELVDLYTEIAVELRQLVEQRVELESEVRA